MARYIDADAYSKAVTETLDSFSDGDKELVDLIRQAIVGSIRLMPTVDVVPVVHGKWNTIKRHRHWPDGSGYEKDYCSMCRFCGSVEYAYCPWCGARMGEKGEGESK